MEPRMQPGCKGPFPQVPSQRLCHLGPLEAQCAPEQTQGWDFDSECAVSHRELMATPFSAGPSHIQFVCGPGVWTGTHVTTCPAPWKAPPSRALSSLHCVKGRSGSGVFQKCEICCEYLLPSLL